MGEFSFLLASVGENKEELTHDRDMILSTGHGDITMDCDGNYCTQIGVTKIPISSILGWVDPTTLQA
jgi:hypothetical protein